MEAFWEDPHFTVRWNAIPEPARWGGEWKDFRPLPQNGALEYLSIWRHKTEDGDVGNVRLPEKLAYLELSWSNAVNVGEVPASLRRLEMHYCTKLLSVSGLAERCPELRFLHLSNCKKFQDLPTLLHLKKLEVLCLNACGDLPDLKFLAQFPRLRDFRFVNTNVIDGDLSPILSHPRLESVGTLDKRHYSHKAHDLETALASRSRDASHP